MLTQARLHIYNTDKTETKYLVILRAKVKKREQFQMELEIEARATLYNMAEQITLTKLVYDRLHGPLMP